MSPTKLSTFCKFSSKQLIVSYIFYGTVLSFAVRLKIPCISCKILDSSVVYLKIQYVRYRFPDSFVVYIRIWCSFCETSYSSLTIVKASYTFCENSHRFLGPVKVPYVPYGILNSFATYPNVGFFFCEAPDSFVL
jgi:hypothetical protein